MNGWQYLGFLAVRKSLDDMLDETFRPARAVPSERRWRRRPSRHEEEN
jgi:hypothetical protein